MFVQLGTSVGLLAPTLEGDARVLIVIAKFRLDANENSICFQQLQKDAHDFCRRHGIEHQQLVQGPVE